MAVVQVIRKRIQGENFFQMFLPEPPVSPWATVLPLVLVMGVCMVKQAGDGGDGDANCDPAVMFDCLEIAGLQYDCGCRVT